VPGYSSVQGLRRWREVASLEPDVVIWWFGMNDCKPALGEPDSRLRYKDASAGDRAMAVLRKLRGVRLAETLGARLRGDVTRASIEEVRAAVAELSARAAAGGPTVIFVACPSRLDEKLAQLDAIVAVARACGAARVDGARDALSSYVPGPPGCDLAARIDEGKDGRVAVLGPGRLERLVLDVEEVARRRDFVRKWKLAVDAYVAAMPQGALGFKDLFDGLTPSEAFSDNCHMNAASARVAADSLAARIADIASRRPKR